MTVWNNFSPQIYHPGEISAGTAYIFLDHLYFKKLFDCSKKLTRIRKLARKHGIEKLTENRETTGELTHSEEKLFACKECGKTLKTIKTLKSHIKTHHRLKVCEKKQKTGEYRYDSSENKVTGVSELESAIRYDL